MIYVTSRNPLIIACNLIRTRQHQFKVLEKNNYTLCSMGTSSRSRTRIRTRTRYHTYHVWVRVPFPKVSKSCRFLSLVPESARVPVSVYVQPRLYNPHLASYINIFCFINGLLNFTFSVIYFVAPI